ncbi:MAG: PQQ-binding-like beta-propeller repeat protein [Phycisphaerae bacterium]
MPALAALVKRARAPAGQPPHAGQRATPRRCAAGSATRRRRGGTSAGRAGRRPAGRRRADADARWALLDARAIGLAQNYFGRSVWTSRFDPLDRDRPFDRLTLVWQLDQLQALRGDASDPRSTWWSLDLDQTDATDATRYLTGPSAPRVVGARFGSAAVVPIHGVHYPVGLLTGRALGPGLLSSAVEADPASPLVVAAGGWFVAAIDDRTLIGWPARDWDGVMWKRFLGSTTIRQLGVADGEVVVIDSARGKALVVRPWSGRLQAQIDLGQPPEAPRSADGRMAPPEPLLSANRLFASDGRSVQAWHAATGRALWQSTFTLPVISLQPLDDARIGVSLANAQFCVLSADDGRVLYEIGAGAEYLLPPLAATIVNGQLVVALRTTGGGPEMTRIAAFDAATGSPSWSRGPLDRCLVNDAMLRGATDYIPILQGLDAGAVSDDSPRLRANFAARRLDTSTYQLLRLRRSDGSWIGQPVALRAAALRNPGAPLDVRVEPDRVLVTFISGYCVVGPATNAGAAEAEPDSDRSTPEDEP